MLRIDVSEDEIAPDSPSTPPPRLRSVVVVPEGSRLATRPRLILPDARSPLAERNGRPVPPPSPGEHALESVLSRLGPPVPRREARFFVTNEEPAPDRRSRLCRETVDRRANRRGQRRKRE